MVRDGKWSVQEALRTRSRLAGVMVAGELSRETVQGLEGYFKEFCLLL